MSKIPGRKVTKKRIHAYDTYKYLISQGDTGHAKGFVSFMKKKHPRIYDKELKPYENKLR